MGLADVVLAQKLKWPKAVPLLMPERYSAAFRTISGRDRPPGGAVAGRSTKGPDEGRRSGDPQIAD
jgi:hypothetical protein